jgi:sulfane dehydrogenase subunit SoxC
MKTTMGEQQYDAIWNKAERCGMSRRKFLMLLSAGGAAAVLSGCTATTTVNKTSTATVTTAATTTATVTATPTATTPTRFVDEPTPPQYFSPIGGGNFEMLFQNMAGREYTMPNSLFFVRDHTQTPQPPVDVTTWSMSIEGDGVASPFTMSYDDLLAMPSTTVTRYIECAGNGRSFFGSLMNNPAQGGQWHLGAYGIAEWTGVKLSDILNFAKITASAFDVMPWGFDSLQVRRPIPVAKAMESDTLLAYMMNGDILPLDHGFPVRCLTPGWVGVNNTKWVNKITVSTTQQYSDFNTKLYVLVGPTYQAQGQALGPPVTTQVVKSALCLPFPATLPVGQQAVTGYAWSPFGTIAKVDVSLDGGNTFMPATLTGSNIERAGTRFQFTFNAVAGNMTITPRATDGKGNVQYPVLQQVWNQQGYLFGAMIPHPVTVK